MSKLLLEKIRGALFGSAIGDAMGGPVEGWSNTGIKETYGWLDHFLSYEKRPSYHGPFAMEAGSYTDDTRLSKLLCLAGIEVRGAPEEGDIAKQLLSRYYTSEDELERGFLEEYCMKALYGHSKEAFGGQPTNGGIMAIAPMGLFFPGNPKDAFAHSFRNLFFCTGYARTATAMAAAMVSAAFLPGVLIQEVVQQGIIASEEYRSKMEGEKWKNWSMYGEVARKSEKLVEKAAAIGEKRRDVRAIQDELLAEITQEFFADGAETLAVAVSMLIAADGDFKQAITGAVNYGRDNDSSASVAGAVAGALKGSTAIPKEWMKQVDSVNPVPKIETLSRLTAEIVETEIMEHIQRSDRLKKLLQ